MIRLKVIPISWSMKSITFDYLCCFHIQSLRVPSDANRLLCQTFRPCVKIMLTMMAKYLLLSACRRKHLALNLQPFKSRAIRSCVILVSLTLKRHQVQIIIHFSPKNARVHRIPIAVPVGLRCCGRWIWVPPKLIIFRGRYPGSGGSPFVISIRTC